MKRGLVKLRSGPLPLVSSSPLCTAHVICQAVPPHWKNPNIFFLLVDSACAKVIIIWDLCRGLGKTHTAFPVAPLDKANKWNFSRPTLLLSWRFVNLQRAHCLYNLQNFNQATQSQSLKRLERKVPFLFLCHWRSKACLTVSSPLWVHFTTAGSTKTVHCWLDLRDMFMPSSLFTKVSNIYFY